PRLLPERRDVPPPRVGARRRARDRVGGQPHDELDLLGLPLHALPRARRPGIPQHWLHFLLKGRPTFARGGWAEVEETHSSGYLVSDALDTRTSAWWTTNVR